MHFTIYISGENENTLPLFYILLEGKIDKKLLHRQELLSAEIPKRYAIHNTLITTFGLTYNEYSGIFSNVITLDELFR